MPKPKDYSCKLFPYTREDCLSMQEVKQNAAWSISAFDLPDAWKLSRGEGVVIAVLDTGCDLNHDDLKNNLLPGINIIDPSKPPIDGCGHGCVDPDCLVHTNFCGIERIETLYERLDAPIQFTKTDNGIISSKDISRLKLKTHCLDENYNPVIGKIKAIHKMPVKGDVIEVTLQGGTEFKLTPWHPVYISYHTKGNRPKITKKRADQLQVLTDSLIFVPRDFKKSLTDEYYRGFANDYRECGNCGHQPLYKKRLPNKNYHCKKCRHIKWIERKKEYLINEDLAYLVGIIATDGYYTRKARRVEVSSNTPEILDGIADICERYKFGFRIENNRILINSTSLTHLLFNLGLPEKNKSLVLTLPEFVGKSPLTVIYSFLAGVIDGDGCISKNNTKNRIISASKKFIDQLCALFNSIGISAGFSKIIDKRKNHKIRGRLVKKNNNIVWHCTFNAVPQEISDLLLHPVKNNRSKSKVKFCKKSRKIREIKTSQYDGYFYDFTTEFGNYIGNGHYVSNTHIAGILVGEDNDIGIVGVAPKAKVRPVKVLDDEGNGNMLNVAAGIRWAIEQKVDFIQMSIGAPMPVQQVRKAMQAAEAKGIVFFVAAGNAGNTKDVFYPAAYPESIAIGAIDESMKRAPFSNTGKNLDFMAPGVDIISTVPENWYAKLSGTSMAAPFACGVAALLLSYKRNGHPEIKLDNSEDYRTIFRKYTTPVVNGNYTDPSFYQGFGIIDPRKFLDQINKPH